MSQRFFVNPVTSEIRAFDGEVEDQPFIASAIAAGFVECLRPPTETESWSNGAWVQDANKVAQELADAMTRQKAILEGAYLDAISQPVSYTTVGGVAKTFQADADSRDNVLYTIAGFQAAQATPSGFYWVAADNTQVPFSYADLQGLAAAMTAQGWTAFQRLQTRKAELNAATDAVAVAGVVW